MGCLGTYAGKMMVCRIIWQFDPLGTSTVSEPVHGAPPTNWSSFGEVQQRWQMLPLLTELGFVFAALPASIRKPCENGLATHSLEDRPLAWSTHLSESCCLSTGDIVDIQTTVVDKLALRSAVAGLRHAVVAPVLCLEEQDGCPVVALVLNETAAGAG